MIRISVLLLVVLIAGPAVALVGPQTYAISVTDPATDSFTVSATSTRNMVSVYCTSGQLRVQAYANGVVVTLVGGGTEASAHVDVPSGATVPIYGVFDTLVFTSPEGGESIGWAWQYKE